VTFRFNKLATAARKFSVDVPVGDNKSATSAPAGASGNPDSIMIGTVGRSRLHFRDDLDA
jgi:hypothetical protein